MICSSNIIFTLYGIAVFAALRKTHLRRATAKKDITSQLPDDNKKDIISQLPDDILISIITRMSTKDAITTSILSKRWRNLYKCVSDIDFGCDDVLGLSSSPHHPYSRFVFNALYRFLRLHSASSKIRSCRFHCCLNKSNAELLKECIYSLGRLGIEELFLCCYCTFTSSDSFFSCQLLSKMPSLKYFTLSTCYLLPNLKIQCNSLQSLTLTSVTVPPGALECFLSHCFSLHSLKIINCKVPSNLCFCGPHLPLESLQIKGCGDVEEIEFYASNLITFEFSNPKLVNFIFNHVPQLQNIYVYSFNNNISSYVCGKLAKDLPRLKSLSFAYRGDFYQGSSRVPMVINPYSNLRRLELRIYCTTETNLLSLTPLLQSCPLLQEFHLDINFEYNEPQVRKEAVVLHSELKKVEISGFRATGNQMEFALYILKCAVGLEKMHISRGCKNHMGFDTWRYIDKTPWSEDARKMIHKQLQGQAISKTAQVIIQHAPSR